MRERAVRMEFEQKGEHASQWAAIRLFAAKNGNQGGHGQGGGYGSGPRGGGGGGYTPPGYDGLDDEIPFVIPFDLPRKRTARP